MKGFLLGAFLISCFDTGATLMVRQMARRLQRFHETPRHNTEELSNLLFETSKLLRRRWDDALAYEAARVINRVMDMDRNAYATTGPFSFLLTSDKKEKFMTIVSEVLDDEKKDRFEENVTTTLRVFHEGNG